MIINKKGFTLVELLVAIAIAIIVGGAITSFVVTGVDAFSKSNKEVNLQYEAQLAINQLQELIIDTTLGLTHNYIGEGGSIVVDKTSAKGSELYIYNRDYAYKITWDKEQRILYYSKGTLKLEEGAVQIIWGNKHIMAEYIKDFDINTNQISTNRLISFDFLFSQDNEKEISTYHNITLRNDVFLNENSDTVYDGDRIENTIQADSVQVYPSSIALEAGSTHDFSAVVKSISGGFPSQDVIWSVDGASNSTMSGSTLTIDTNENDAEILTVRATAAKSSISGISIVTVQKVKKIEVITITGENLDGTLIGPGETKEFYVKTTGTNNADYPQFRKNVSVSINGIELTPLDKESGKYSLTIPEEAASGSTFEVRARYDRNVYTVNDGTAQIKVDKVNPKIELSPKQAVVNRNSSVDIIADISGIKDYGAINWKVEYRKKNESRWTVLSNTDYTVNGTTLTLAPKEYRYDFSSEYQFKAMASITKNGHAYSSNITELIMNKVAIKYKLSNSNYGNGETITIANGQTVYVECIVEGIDSSSVSFKSSNNKNVTCSITSNEGDNYCLKIEGKRKTNFLSNVSIQATIQGRNVSNDKENRLTVNVNEANVGSGQGKAYKSDGYYSDKTQEKKTIEYFNNKYFYLRYEYSGGKDCVLTIVSKTWNSSEIRRSYKWDNNRWLRINI